MYRRVIVPTDGSELAMKGVKEGMKLARYLDIPVTAVHVVDIGDISLTGKMEESLRKSAENILREVEDLAEELEVEIESKTFKGTPYKRISEYAQKDDVIYISSHGSSGFRELFMGSTTQRLLNHADCTVSVVKGTPGKI